MLSLKEQSYMEQIYADIADDMPDDEMLELIEQLDKMDADSKFSYILRYAGKEDQREEESPCCGGLGCNYCLMTTY